MGWLFSLLASWRKNKHPAASCERRRRYRPPLILELLEDRLAPAQFGLAGIGALGGAGDMPATNNSATAAIWVLPLGSVPPPLANGMPGCESDAHVPVAVAPTPDIPATNVPVPALTTSGGEYSIAWPVMNNGAGGGNGTGYYVHPGHIGVPAHSDWSDDVLLGHVSSDGNIDVQAHLSSAGAADSLYCCNAQTTGLSFSGIWLICGDSMDLTGNLRQAANVLTPASVPIAPDVRTVVCFQLDATGAASPVNDEAGACPVHPFGDVVWTTTWNSCAQQAGSARAGAIGDAARNATSVAALANPNSLFVCSGSAYAVYDTLDQNPLLSRPADSLFVAAPVTSSDVPTTSKYVIGPRGCGSSHWVTPVQPLPYQITFRYGDSAPAWKAIVTRPIEPRPDGRAFRLWNFLAGLDEVVDSLADSFLDVLRAGMDGTSSGGLRGTETNEGLVVMSNGAGTYETASSGPASLVVTGVLAFQIKRSILAPIVPTCRLGTEAPLTHGVGQRSGPLLLPRIVLQAHTEQLICWLGSSPLLQEALPMMEPVEFFCLRWHNLLADVAR